MAAVRSASFSGEMVVMTENSMGRSIRQTWRALRHERLMSRPARRDRRGQLGAVDQGGLQQRGPVRPTSPGLDRLNITPDHLTTESKHTNISPPTHSLHPPIRHTTPTYHISH